MATHTVAQVCDKRVIRRMATALIEQDIGFAFGIREATKHYELIVCEADVDQALEVIRNTLASCDECCAGPCRGPRMRLCQKQNKV